MGFAFFVHTQNKLASGKIMPTIITLLTDFGEHGYYVAALKAQVLRECPQAHIVDISHRVKSGDLAEAAFLLSAAYQEFPEDTVHLVAVGSASHPNRRFVAMKYQGHYFVGPDNGVLTLYTGKEVPAVVALPDLGEGESNTFPSKRVLAKAAAQLSNASPLSALGSRLEEWEWEKKHVPVIKDSEDQLRGQVVFVDQYGNLVTNIHREEFERVGRGRRYEVRCAYERFHQLATYYNSRDFGDCVLLFNSLGLLEIAINQGNASELLGMARQSPVMVRFMNEPSS